MDTSVGHPKSNGRDRHVADASKAGLTSGPRPPHKPPASHYRRPTQNAFVASERAATTILFIGLTWKHGRLIQASLEGLGYKCQQLPDPDRAAFQIGKEYGNPGQCNPTYFSTGCLIQFLQGLERDGLSREQIAQRYVFITAGACGPCRFGMYEAEFRLALTNAGFADMRVILFQQHGLNQAGEEAGLHVNADFVMALIMSFALADLINDISYQIRPYEVNDGETDAALATSIDELAAVIKDLAHRQAARSVRKSRLPMTGTVHLMARLVYWFRAAALTDALEQIRHRFGDIEIDRTRPRPIVKTTGEFWAQTTEGDGNYGLLGFLEREGAEVVAEPVGAWLPFSVHQARVKARDRLMLSSGSLRQQLSQRWRRLRSFLLLVAVDGLYMAQWRRLRRILGDMPRLLPDQLLLRELADPFYNYRSGGGEGHLEVGKNIYYHSHRLCHMVLSIKPFGCLPSTQSDGAQSAVTSHYPEMVFLPIETSGEGEINAHSRVQMALGDVRQRARDELDHVLNWSGVTLPEVEAFVQYNPVMRCASYRVPKSDRLVSVAANFVAHVAYLMDRVQIPAPLDRPAVRPSGVSASTPTPLLQIEGAAG
ncbi:MAG: activator of (R)-2-hydroxyglutaryl-CoA dehydratase [Gemmatimonadetes bacterium]|jgi:predicted nucleotide-binding protein (sugar kinase/HSP70/actin superfamily)|nr:activator of (R)-2-hydroxyglutaryl-CoA dehydratase [Gemmatimonadota bacterium]MBT5060385.1 activator of (R)-2-hydroxyglutaryl-CoA dehydratase [Gemmatimonadota bacterium]MBT5146040.1 activator of (R)-2-hydroxyglutaryl-CoA dehydratase [Gemmatimonadota bacterium]MBT5591881.1 activator of (R)-2-hydroxyglutaryl-CoA dehydratase [Gemmatimonadota bacterium]MBT5961556.1 activator of (R)-2-hydroxyglutaryl-CoA dehydratase [Gemmatimonadota bacterium]